MGQGLEAEEVLGVGEELEVEEDREIAKEPGREGDKAGGLGDKGISHLHKNFYFYFLIITSNTNQLLLA